MSNHRLVRNSTILVQELSRISAVAGHECASRRLAASGESNHYRKIMLVRVLRRTERSTVPSKACQTKSNEGCLLLDPRQFETLDGDT
jgi:hypothetical protein